MMTKTAALYYLNLELTTLRNPYMYPSAVSHHLEQARYYFQLLQFIELGWEG